MILYSYVHFLVIQTMCSQGRKGSSKFQAMEVFLKLDSNLEFSFVIKRNGSDKILPYWVLNITYRNLKALRAEQAKAPPPDNKINTEFCRNIINLKH